MLLFSQLKKSAKQTKTVRYLKLGKTVKEPLPGTSCLVAGWGTTASNVQKMSDVLMSVNVTVIDRVKCNSPEYYGLKPVITSSMICAGSNGKTQADTCQVRMRCAGGKPVTLTAMYNDLSCIYAHSKGDSGGPLLCNGTLVGVTSSGQGCGKIKKPGIYSFLTEKQLMWIKKTMKDPQM